eukprot:11399889-Ditylum_brightwellii.AAC.1
MNNATTTQFASNKPSNIGYAQLLKECNKLANISSHLSNEHIHVVYSMLVGMNKVVETGDHDPNNHKGKAREVFVKQLAAFDGVSVQASTGGAKRKNINSYGPQTNIVLDLQKATFLVAVIKKDLQNAHSVVAGVE